MSLNIQRLRILTRRCHHDGCGGTVAADVHGGANAIEAETGILLYALVRRMAPKVVVETGTHWGWSAGWIASALADNHGFTGKQGHLWTVDVNPHSEKPERLWDELRVADFVTHALAVSWNWTPELPGPIDMLWLDADHAAESIGKEWEHFSNHLADPSLVCFHDTYLDRRMHDGIETIKACAEIDDWNVSHAFFRNMRGFDALWLSKLGPRHPL